MNPTKIIYTKTDEAPALATVSLLPIIKKFVAPADIVVETRDISLAGRIIAHFPEYLRDEQRLPNALNELGEWVKTPSANIIKLPNISASIPQLKAAIKELQGHGLPVPSFPENPQNEKEREIKGRYAKILGSAVNPVLREGNSDRRVAGPVKEYAQKNPYPVKEWDSDSPSHVASMNEGDFYASEKSVIVEKAQNLKIELMATNGEIQVLREKVSVDDGEVIDGSRMSVRLLRSYLEREMEAAKEQDLLLSLHLKATMMKVSDPIIFGEVLQVYFGEVFKEFEETFKEIGVNPRNGLGDLYSKLDQLPPSREKIKKEIFKALEKAQQKRPPLAMVDSAKGISNFHVPSDVIIDASMPAMIRAGGKMWGADGREHPTKALIPDRSYAGIYQATIDFCKKHGAFDPRSMGNVSNVGLMAKKAQEYGSHDKTFSIERTGTVRVLSKKGDLLMEHSVEEGDIWRMCQTKEVAIRDWIQLGLKRAETTGHPAVFWLDPQRAHDSHLIEKVKNHLISNKEKRQGGEVKILSPKEACRYTLERLKKGQDTISVTGNVLRDYLTDLFPILELGTSAKMLSIVPLLAGGGLFETGAGGSAPKHVQQLLEENHLRWDSLGEFLALTVSLEDLGEKGQNPKASLLAWAFNQANQRYLNDNKAPSRKVGELDNRGSHFYWALYGAEALAQQDGHPELKKSFTGLAEQLRQNEAQIVEELRLVQGKRVDIGGYYHPDETKVSQAMRPSSTLNRILEEFSL